MKREALTDPYVQTLVTRDFVSAQIDAEQHPSLVEEYGVRLFPTVLVLTPQGKLMDRIEGYVTAGQLTNRLENLSASFISQR